MAELDQSSHFDQVADGYDEVMPAHVVEHYLEKRTGFISGLAAGGKVLDVGCGTGALAGKLAGRGLEVTGVDTSPGMLEVARREYPELEVEVGSATSLPFEDGSFDVVYCVAVLHHIAEPGAVRAAIREMVRVTAPGGHTVIWDHNPLNPYWKLLMARVPQDEGDERLIPREEILAALDGQPVGEISARRMGLVPDFTPRFLLGAARRLEAGVEKRSRIDAVCAHNVVVATRSGN